MWASQVLRTCLLHTVRSRKLAAYADIFLVVQSAQRLHCDHGHMEQCELVAVGTEKQVSLI